MEPTFDFEISAEEPCVLSIVGPLDADTAPSVREAIHDQRRRVAVVDGRRLTIVAAAGLSLFVELAGEGSLDVVGSDELVRLIEICGLEDRLRVLPAMPRFADAP